DGEYQYDQARTLPMYAEVLRNYGVDLAAPAAAGARVRATRLRLELLAALADWRMITPDKAERQQLEEVIEAADPPEAMRAPWRLHAAALREDLAEVARGVRELIELAKEPSVQQLPVAVVVHLAHDLGICKQWPAAEQLLRAALARKPGDFWLNHNLGVALVEQGPARAGEAVRELRGALGPAGQEPGPRHQTGTALCYQKDFLGA